MPGGTLVVRPSATGTTEEQWLWDVFVDEVQRGKGYARGSGPYVSREAPKLTGMM